MYFNNLLIDVVLKIVHRFCMCNQNEGCKRHKINKTAVPCYAIQCEVALTSSSLRSTTMNHLS